MTIRYLESSILVSRKDLMIPRCCRDQTCDFSDTGWSVCWPSVPVWMNRMVMMWLPLVSTSHSEQSNKQRRSSVPVPAAVYLISECHSVISERRLPETFFQLVFNLLKRLPWHQSYQWHWFHFNLREGGVGFTLRIKALASNHTDTLRAQLKRSSVFGSLH